ncbi:hypothetical protein P3342_011141 [Pyrenophora teres f. teres]|nr:hypothetical protein P3342_011141 [Pyrenophora teres f. teres]
MSERILLPAFSASVTELDARTTGTFCSSHHLTEQILKLSSWLIDLSKKKTLFGKYTVDPYTPSLETLFDRLHNKQLGPSLLPSGFIHVDRLNERTNLRVDGEAAYRPLYEYEDLYYALNARMQEMHQLLNLRLRSGFNTITDTVYEGGPNIALFHEKLSGYWTSINKSSCGKALDNAVREAKVMALRQELLWQMENAQITQDDADVMAAKLYSDNVFNNVTGLTYFLDWAPSWSAHTSKQSTAACSTMRSKKLPPKSVTLNAGVPKAVSPRRRNRTTRRVHHEPPKKTYGETCYPDQYLASILNKGQSIPSPTTFNMQHAKDQATMQDSPKYTAQLHAGHYHQEHSAPIYDAEAEAEEKLEYERQERAIIERKIAEEREEYEDLKLMLEWKDKLERVLEYSEYLRANASASAQYAVQSTRINAKDGFMASRYGNTVFYEQDIDFEPYGGEF